MSEQGEKKKPRVDPGPLAQAVSVEQAVVATEAKAKWDEEVSGAH